MTAINQYKFLKYILYTITSITLIFYGEPTLYILIATFIYLIMIFRALKLDSKKRFRFLLILIYTLLLIIQVSIILLTRSKESDYYIKEIIITTILFIPLILEKIFTIKKYTAFYFPSTEDINVISFYDIHKLTKNFNSKIDDINSLKSKLNKESLSNVTGDLKRHNSSRYINNNSLNDEYFIEANKSLDDNNIYIVVSNTGSDASELISVFTKKQYNHVSLSFDRDLKTTISYNGGENIYPPGLNNEIISFFNKKQGSSILVYNLACTKEQKQMILEKIKNINEEGSAYNILGLILKTSLKPNIMFCSQFVYNMLKHANLNYFTMNDGYVKPTDFVELDYYRKLDFCYDIFFNK